MFEDQSCRSVNFNKAKTEKNCEFLKDVSTEKLKVLLDDGDYDYYILITPNRVSMKNCFYGKFHVLSITFKNVLRSKEKKTINGKKFC